MAVGPIGCLARSARGATVLVEPAAEIEAEIAIATLIDAWKAAAMLAERAVGTPILPEIVEGGLIAGGACAGGVRRRGRQSTGSCNIVCGSFGLQIGALSYGQAIFSHDRGAPGVSRPRGWRSGSIGLDVCRDGMRVAADTSTLQDPIIAFTFGEQALTDGRMLEGSTIPAIDR